MKNPKIYKKKHAVTPAACAVSLQYGFSSMETFMMVGASNSDNDLKDKILSKSTTIRLIKKFAIEKSEKITSNKLSVPSEQYTLHWDGKIFKSLTHCDKKKKGLLFF